MNRPFIRALGIGGAGAAIAGIVLRDLVPMAVAMGVLGVVAGLIDAKRAALVGLLAGQVTALPLLMAIEFGTTLGTFVNSTDFDEFAGLWPLVALLWLAFLGCGAVGFIVGSRVGHARRARRRV